MQAFNNLTLLLQDHAVSCCCLQEHAISAPPGTSAIYLTPNFPTRYNATRDLHLLHLKGLSAPARRPIPTSSFQNWVSSKALHITNLTVGNTQCPCYGSSCHSYGKQSLIDAGLYLLRTHAGAAERKI
jgi:hypothetical protein